MIIIGAKLKHVEKLYVNDTYIGTLQESYTYTCKKKFYGWSGFTLQMTKTC